MLIYLLMSHQAGARFSALSDQMIEFIATLRADKAIQAAKEHWPTFQDWNILLESEKRTSEHARIFAMGTRGNVGSILGTLYPWDTRGHLYSTLSLW